MPLSKATRLMSLWRALPEPLALPKALGVATLITAAATALGLILVPWLPLQGLSLIYLLVVLIAAIGFGITTGLATSVLSFLALNFFFIPPTYTFTIANPSELVALLAFFAAALVTGSLAGRMREVAHDAKRHAATLERLNDFAAKLSGAVDEETILKALVTQAAATIEGQSVVLMPRGNDLVVVAAMPNSPIIETADIQSADRALRTRDAVYAAARGWPGARFEFRPIATEQGSPCVLGLAPATGSRRVERADDAAVETILKHAAIALDRTRLERDRKAARDEIEEERLRSALLSALSHDLKTPLASILGSVTSLRDRGLDLSEETRADLLAAIEEEASRLAQFVANLLDMTRLDAEGLDLARDWIDIADCTQLALRRARALYPQRPISFAPTETIPPIRGDATLFEHVVFNVVENALKFSRPAGTVAIALTRKAESADLTITDDGPGIDAEALPHIFDKFYRARRGDQEPPGTGLGLTIARRIVEGHGGTIKAESPVSAHRGTRITIRLPIPTHEPRP